MSDDRERGDRRDPHTRRDDRDDRVDTSEGARRPSTHEGEGHGDDAQGPGTRRGMGSDTAGAEAGREAEFAPDARHDAIADAKQTSGLGSDAASADAASSGATGTRSTGAPAAGGHADPGVAATIGGGSSGMTFEETQDTGETVRLKVFRGKGSGIYQTYEIPKSPGMVVLDCIHEIQKEQEPDLACRWNCKAGKCGSCSAEINGKPKLMCMTRLSDLDTSKPIQVAPLKAFPVIKDLVTDVSWNYEQNKRITPFTPRDMTAEEKAKGEFKMQQVDVDRVQEFRKCIECFLCQDVCHVLRTHEKHDVFQGPRFMIRYAGLEMNPADSADRIDDVWDTGGIGYCNITKCCTEVCPEHITITDNGIIPMKERVAQERFDPVVWVWRKLTGKKRDKAARRRKQVGLPMAK